jgi:hypothetical protein
MTGDRPDPAPDGEGAMTGATGSLTPPASDEEFIPAERREVMGPDQASVTRQQHVETGPTSADADQGVEDVPPPEEDRR